MNISTDESSTTNENHKLSFDNIDKFKHRFSSWFQPKQSYASYVKFICESISDDSLKNKLIKYTETHFPDITSQEDKLTIAYTHDLIFNALDTIKELISTDIYKLDLMSSNWIVWCDNSSNQLDKSQIPIIYRLISINYSIKHLFNCFEEYPNDEMYNIVSFFIEQILSDYDKCVNRPTSTEIDHYDNLSEIALNVLNEN